MQEESNDFNMESNSGEYPEQTLKNDKSEDLAKEKWDESIMKDYALRSPGEDPKYAVNIARIWLGIVLFMLLFIITLLVLGAFYD